MTLRQEYNPQKNSVQSVGMWPQRQLEMVTGQLITITDSATGTASAYCQPCLNTLWAVSLALLI